MRKPQSSQIVRDLREAHPRRRAGIVHTAEGSWEVKGGVLRTSDPNIDLPLNELF